MWRRDSAACSGPGWSVELAPHAGAVAYVDPPAVGQVGHDAESPAARTLLRVGSRCYRVEAVAVVDYLHPQERSPCRDSQLDLLRWSQARVSYAVGHQFGDDDAGPLEQLLVEMTVQTSERPTRRGRCVHVGDEGSRKRAGGLLDRRCGTHFACSSARRRATRRSKLVMGWGIGKPSASNSNGRGRSEPAAPRMTSSWGRQARPRRLVRRCLAGIAPGAPLRLRSDAPPRQARASRSARPSCCRSA